MSDRKPLNESLGYTVLYYLGVMVGLFSTLWVYPRDLELYGIYGFLTNTASLFTPFITLGFGAVLIRYFPYDSQDGKGGSNVFSLVLLGYFMGAILFGLTFFFLKDHWLVWLPNADPAISNYLFWLFPLTLVFVFYDLIQTCSVNHQRIAFPALLVNSFKLILPVLFLLVVHDKLDHVSFIALVIGYYVVISAILLVSIYRMNPQMFKISLNLGKIKQLKPILSFAAFNVVSGVSAIMALRIDALMVAAFMGANSAGLFVLALFMSNAVFIPAQSLVDLLNPSVSLAAKTQDLSRLKNLYSRSVILMLIPTISLSLILWFSFEQLAGIMPNTDQILKLYWVLFFLLLARMMDAATGINHHIINYSKYYRIESILLLLLAISNIALNYWLIPIFGMKGAAAGTFISVGLYNALKSILIWKIFRLNPFTLDFVKLIGFIAAMVLFLFLIQNPLFGWVQIILNGIVVCLGFLYLILSTTISPDLKDRLLQLFQILKHWIKSN
ncbi:MAG: polysaccharide biosynthesis C-terminal domain-containing protein [Saprospiraceae bacterium]|nr:polysaccharide biosynthesis C-terminal domain-containing protein [Saprospiraceae bacterium]